MSSLLYLNTTPVIMLVILRLRSFLIYVSLNWSLIAGFGGEDSATKSEALHVPRKCSLKRPQSTKLQTNGLYFKIIRSYTVQHQLSKQVKKIPGSAPEILACLSCLWQLSFWPPLIVCIILIGKAGDSAPKIDASTPQLALASSISAMNHTNSKSLINLQRKSHDKFSQVKFEYYSVV